MRYWKRGQEGGRKSFRYEELDPDFFFHAKPGIFVPYLDPLQKIYLCEMLDSCSVFSYNMDSLVIYHCTMIKFKGAINYAK